MQETIDSGRTPAQVDRWPPRLLMLTVLVALGVCFDGFDNLILPPSLPLLSKSWGVKPMAFAPVFALSTVGYVIGSVLAGAACDRIGRRISLIASVVVIGVGSLSSAMADGLTMLTCARVITGIGIGGTLVSAFTAVPEFTPPRWRSIAVAATTLCEPVGGFLASSVCAVFLADYGWRTLFVVGGVVPLLYALLLAARLVETPAFLATRPLRQQDLQRVLAKLGLDNDSVLARAPSTHQRPGIASLFIGRYRRDTLLLSMSGFLWLLFLFMILSWLPALVSASGASIRLSSSVLATFSLGATLGAMLSVFLVRPLGTRVPLVVFGALMALTSALLAWQFGLSDPSPPTLLVLIGMAGFACAAGQSFLFVLMPQVYDPEHRGTGVGFSLGVGRLGTIAAAFVGGLALGGGGRAFFGIELVIGLGAVLCAIAVGPQVPPFWKGAPGEADSLAPAAVPSIAEHELLATVKKARG